MTKKPFGHKTSETIIKKLSQYAKEFWYLFPILLLAVVVGFFSLLSQTFFYYDQARDAYEAYDIWHNLNPKILGPGTDIPGLFHGVLWYYLISIPYAINNSPQFVTIMLFIIMFLGIIPVGYLANQLFHEKRVAVIAVILYAFSPLFQLSSRWLSNPVLGLFITPILMISVWEYIRKQSIRWGVISGMCFGILIQSNLAYALLIYLIPLYFLIYRSRPKLIPGLAFLLSLFVMVSSFLLSELKFHWQGLAGAIAFLRTPHESMVISLELINRILLRVTDFVSTTFFILPTWVVVLLLVSICAVVMRRKESQSEVIFLLVWISNMFVFLIFNTGISNSLFAFYPSLIALILLVSIGIARFPIRLAGIIVGMIVLMQLYTGWTYVAATRNPLTVQTDMVLPLEQQVIDYTYQASDFKPFTINTITVPLYINTTWAYLYTFYAEPKYHYLPYWGGKDQTGSLGSLPSEGSKPEYRYLIIEPSTGIPDYFITQTLLEEDQITTLIEEKKIGTFRIQKRKYSGSTPTHK